jgi:hypothetical protein
MALQNIFGHGLPTGGSKTTKHLRGEDVSPCQTLLWRAWAPYSKPVQHGWPYQQVVSSLYATILLWLKMKICNTQVVNIISYASWLSNSQCCSYSFICTCRK